MGVINRAQHKQTRARPLFFHRELTNVQKALDPTVLFPCAESETEKDEEGGGGLEAQQLLLYPLGMLSEGRGGSLCERVSWIGEKKE